MTNLQAIPFPPTNQTIWAGQPEQGEPLVALRPICANIGLGWGSMTQKLKADPVLNPTVTMIVTVGADGKARETICLPLRMIPGWLFKIDSRRVKPEIRETLLAYQRECFGVLAAHFGARLAGAPVEGVTVKTILTDEGGENAPDLIDRPLEVLQAQLSMVREARLLRGMEAAKRLWDRLNLPCIDQTPEENPFVAFRDEMLVREAGAAIPAADLAAAFNAWTQGSPQDVRTVARWARAAGMPWAHIWSRAKAQNDKGIKGWRIRAQ